MNLLRSAVALSCTVLVVSCVLAPVSAAARSKAPTASVSPRFLTVLAGQAAPAPQKTSETPLPEGKGKDTTIKVCTKCHGTDQFSHLRQSKAKWNDIIDLMISKGLEASDADLDVVTDYLATTFPAPPAKDAPAADKK